MRSIRRYALLGLVLALAGAQPSAGGTGQGVSTNDVSTPIICSPSWGSMIPPVCVGSATSAHENAPPFRAG